MYFLSHALEVHSLAMLAFILNIPQNVVQLEEWFNILALAPKRDPIPNRVVPQYESPLGHPLGPSTAGEGTPNTRTYFGEGSYYFQLRIGSMLHPRVMRDISVRMYLLFVLLIL